MRMYEAVFCIPLIAAIACPAQQQIDKRTKVEQLAAHHTSTNEGEIGDLVDAVFFQHGITGATADFARPVRQALITAQAEYDRGHYSGISETELVAAFNKMADSINAPAYAHTNINEIRRFRVVMFLDEPHMIGRPPLSRSMSGTRATSGNKSVNGAILNSNVGPLEAFHVASSLLVFKQFSASYQLTEEERVRALKERGVPELDPQTASLRRSEMQSFLRTSTQNMSLMDAYAIAVTAIHTVTKKGVN